MIIQIKKTGKSCFHLKDYFLLDINNIKIFGLKNESMIIWDAILEVYNHGYRTVDLVRHDTANDKILKTDQFGDKVREFIIEKSKPVFASEPQ